MTKLPETNVQKILANLDLACGSDLDTGPSAYRREKGEVDSFDSNHRLGFNIWGKLRRNSREGNYIACGLSVPSNIADDEFATRFVTSRLRSVKFPEKSLSAAVMVTVDRLDEVIIAHCKLDIDGSDKELISREINAVTDFLCSTCENMVAELS
jgi:hypothetical protein